MKTKETFFVLIMTLFTMVLTPSCQSRSGQEAGAAPTDSIASTGTTSQTETDTPEYLADDTTTDEPETAASPAAPAETKPAAKKATTVYEGGKETLYISTYGANGKVWGHVTMNGKTGRGTIHDESENSYSITVTRHGGELFGTDQNGRQYVFRM